VQGCSWVRMMCGAAHGIVVGRIGDPTNAKTTCRTEETLNMLEAFIFLVMVYLSTGQACTQQCFNTKVHRRYVVPTSG
jgi:hypothetical protein